MQTNRPLTRSPFSAKYLDKYKLPGSIYAEKDEGFDGHLTWDGDDPKIVTGMNQFVYFAKAGNFDEVKKILDRLGVVESDAQLDDLTALVSSGSIELIKQALLSVICVGHRPLVEFVLQLFKDMPSEENCGCSDSDSFPPHVTPLMLACILNHMAIVECLLLRGHKLKCPHHLACACDQCYRMPYAALSATEKVDILRAVTSDSYLWLATSDPFASACALSHDLKQYIRDDDLEFSNEYEAMLKSVNRFVARMVDQNWNEIELDTFLTHKCETPLSFCEYPYPRVQMALSSNMRDFVASTNVQRSMAESWWTAWGNFGASPKRDAYRVFRHGLCYPLLAIFFLINEKFVESFHVPLARYISNISSYFTFIMALIGMRVFKYSYPSKAVTLSCEIYVFIYVIGMLFERYLLFSEYGFKHYFKYWWRWFDFLLIGIFLLAFHIWICDCLIPYSKEVENSAKKHLPAYHSSNLYEIYVGIGSLLAIWRIFYYFLLLKWIGATLNSVGKCVPSVVKYLVIMLMIMVSFSYAISYITRPYMGNTAINGDGKQIKTADRFDGPFQSFRNLYWSFYGYLDNHDITVIAGNSGPDNRVVDHGLTTQAVESLYAIFCVIIILMMLNLMISFLTRVSDSILENQDEEFKYTRVVIYTEYQHWSAALPPPFNILHVIKRSALNLVRKDIQLKWPEIFVPRDIWTPNIAADPSHMEDCRTYEKLLWKMLRRSRGSRENHFRTVFRTEFDHKDKPMHPLPKVAFMNCSMKLRTDENNKKIG